MNNFQTILVAIFLAFFIFAVMIFSGMIKIGGSSSASKSLAGKITIWGTFNSPDIYKVFDNTRDVNRDLIIDYAARNESNYKESLIEGFASGKGPDIFFITPDMVQKFSDYVYIIPYASYPEKAFRDAFIDGADAYLGQEGIVGFPIVTDPMVMYYNKDIIANEGVVSPPVYWDELFNLGSKLTKKKNDGTILQSMIALGRYENITHAKDILATLLLQGNNPIIKRTLTGGYTSTINDTSGDGTSSFEPILNFYTGFSNPSDSAYTWNRALPESIDSFTGGKLAFYLGRASELFKIQSVNPNLSFDVTSIPQIKNSATKRTYGEIYAVAVNKKAVDLATTLGVASLISTGDVAKNFAAAVSLPPASKALLAERPTDPYLYTFFNSTIISRTWLDPDDTLSNKVFSELIENIVSNKLEVDSAISKAQLQLNFIIKK